MKPFLDEKKKKKKMSILEEYGAFKDSYLFAHVLKIPFNTIV